MPVAALAASLVLVPAVRAVARRTGTLAYPDSVRRFHAAPVPLWGGVAVYLAWLAGILVIRLGPAAGDPALADLCRGLIPAAGLACLFGALDDRWNLAPRLKLVLQVLAVTPIVAAGYWVDFLIIFGCRIELGGFGIPLTILWLLGCINALNLIDGMDGLAALVGLSSAAMLALVALSLGHAHVAMIAFLLAGALAGFLFYNLPPASIFLGDSGSTLVGLVLGILGIAGDLKTSATLSITAPAVVMTLPMFDVFMALLRRRLTGRRFDAGDRQHIHHRLLERGFGPRQVLCLVSALCLTTGAAATAATIFRIDALAWITATTLIVLLIRLRWFGYYEFSLVRGAVRRGLNSLARPFARQRTPAAIRSREVVFHTRETARQACDTAAAMALRDPAPDGALGRGGSVLPMLAASVRQPPVGTAPRPGEPDLDVGVVYSGERALLEPLLGTLAASAEGLRIRLILVDNHSPDGVGGWTGVVPNTLVLRNRRRFPYAVNLNRVLAASTARYVLLLNTDMFFDPRQQCLARMVQFMDAEPDCGIAGCRIYHADGSDAPSARRFQTASIIAARRLGLGRLMRRTLNRYFYREHAPGESFDCDWLSGCFLMVRREAFQQAGLFDESFGKYFEDVDMCLRVCRAGWRVRYHGRTSCYHLEARASRRWLSADAWRHLRAYACWLGKWGSSPGRSPAGPARIRNQRDEPPPPPVYGLTLNGAAASRVGNLDVFTAPPPDGSAERRSAQTG